MTTDLDRLHALLGETTPLNWVFTGDSITHGLVHTVGARNYVDHLHELIRGDLSRVQDAVINTAISGWRIAQLLDDFDRRVATWHPQVVTLMIGTNDCSTDHSFPVIEPAEFAASVTEFVARVRGLRAIPVLQTQPSVDSLNAPERARIGDFAQAIRDLASREGTILVDQHSRFAALGAGRQGGIPWGLMSDPFHPNATGHAVIALEIATALGLEATASRTLRTLHARLTAGR